MAIQKKKQPRFTGRITRIQRSVHPEVESFREELETDPDFLRDLERVDELANQLADERHIMEYPAPLCHGGGA